MKIIKNKLGFSTLLKKEVMRFLKVYIQTILAPLLSNMLFLGVFGSALSTREVGIEGINYLSFLVPGLCTMGAIFGSFQNPSSSLIIQKYHGTIEELNTYPISNFEKNLAFVLGGTLRGLIVGLLTFISTIPFVGFGVQNLFLFLLSLTSISFVFSSIGVIVGLVVNDFDKVSFITNIVLTPFVYFGGVFFEVSKLPGIFSKIAFLNPIFPLVDTARLSYLGASEGSIIFNLAFIGILILLSFSIAFKLFSKGAGLKN